MIDVLNEARGLTASGKFIASGVVVLISILLLILIWQSPKKAGSETPTASTVETDAQVAQSTTGNTPERSVESAQPRIARRRTTRPIASELTEQPRVNVGDVTSHNQSGGVTAGSVGSVTQE